MGASPRKSRVEEAIVLLKQARSVHSESNAELSQSLDEVIRLLESGSKESGVSMEAVLGAVALLGKFVEAIPAIERLIQMLSKQ